MIFFSIDKKDVEKNIVVKDGLEEFDGVNKIQLTLRPLVILQTIFCINRSLEPISSVQKVRHFVALILVVVGTVFVCTYRVKQLYVCMKTVPVITDALSLIVLGCTVFCNIIVSAYHCTETFSKYYNRGENLVRDLKLDESICWKEARKMVIKMIIVVLVPLTGIFVYDFLVNIYFQSVTHALLYLINYIFTFANALISLQFICSLAYCRQVFSVVNLKIAWIHDSKYGTNMTEDIVKENNSFLIQGLLFWIKDLTKCTMRSIKTYEYKLEDIIDTFFINCDQCDYFNCFYKEQNLLMTINSLTAIVRSLYAATNHGFFFRSKGKEQEFYPAFFFATCLLVFHDIIMLVSITAACEMVVSEARKAVKTIDLLLYRSRKDERDQLTLWSSLAYRRLPVFTACNCFTINFALLYQIGATVITYLIILIQMKDY